MAFPTTDLEHGGRGDALVKVVTVPRKPHISARETGLFVPYLS